MQSNIIVKFLYLNKEKKRRGLPLLFSKFINLQKYITNVTEVPSNFFILTTIKGESEMSAITKWLIGGPTKTILRKTYIVKNSLYLNWLRSRRLNFDEKLIIGLMTNFGCNQVISEVNGRAFYSTTYSKGVLNETLTGLVESDYHKGLTYSNLPEDKVEIYRTGGCNRSINIFEVKVMFSDSGIWDSICVDFLNTNFAILTNRCLAIWNEIYRQAPSEYKNKFLSALSWRIVDCNNPSQDLNIESTAEAVYAILSSINATHG